MRPRLTSMQSRRLCTSVSWRSSRPRSSMPGALSKCHTLSRHCGGSLAGREEEVFKRVVAGSSGAHSIYFVIMFAERKTECGLVYRNLCSQVRPLRWVSGRIHVFTHLAHISFRSNSCQACLWCLCCVPVCCDPAGSTDRQRSPPRRPDTRRSPPGRGWHISANSPRKPVRRRNPACAPTSFVPLTSAQYHLIRGLWERLTPYHLLGIRFIFSSMSVSNYIWKYLSWTFFVQRCSYNFAVVYCVIPHRWKSFTVPCAHLCIHHELCLPYEC